MSAPYYTGIVPTAGTTITTAEAVSVGVYCNRPIALITVTAFYDSMQTAETVWVGSVDIAGTVSGTFFSVYATGCAATAMAMRSSTLAGSMSPSESSDWLSCSMCPMSTSKIFPPARAASTKSPMSTP